MAHKKGHKIGGKQGARAGLRDKGGKNRKIIKDFKRKSFPLATSPRTGREWE